MTETGSGLIKSLNREVAYLSKESEALSAERDSISRRMDEAREKLKSGITPPRILHAEVASINRSVDRFMGLLTKWSSRLEMRWVADNRHRFSGQWIAIQGNTLLATGNTAQEVFAKVADQRIIPLVIRIEDEDRPFAGW